MKDYKEQNKPICRTIGNNQNRKVPNSFVTNNKNSSFPHIASTLQRVPYRLLNDNEWSIVQQAISNALAICESNLEHPDEFNAQVGIAFNRRNVSQRTYIPQLTRIYNLLRTLTRNNFIIDENPAEDYCAQVNPSDSNHIIELGTQFWTLSDTGEDSRAGTILHEITHFTDVIGTDDHAYGDEADVQSLLGLSSTLGGNNADTWEHALENSYDS